MRKKEENVYLKLLSLGYEIKGMYRYCSQIAFVVPKRKVYCIVRQNSQSRNIWASAILF